MKKKYSGGALPTEEEQNEIIKKYLDAPTGKFAKTNTNLFSSFWGSDTAEDTDEDTADQNLINFTKLSPENKKKAILEKNQELNIPENILKEVTEFINNNENLGDKEKKKLRQRFQILFPQLNAYERTYIANMAFDDIKKQLQEKKIQEESKAKDDEEEEKYEKSDDKESDDKESDDKKSDDKESDDKESDDEEIDDEEIDDEESDDEEEKKDENMKGNVYNEFKDNLISEKEADNYVREQIKFETNSKEDQTDYFEKFVGMFSNIFQNIKTNPLRTFFVLSLIILLILITTIVYSSESKKDTGNGDQCNNQPSDDGGGGGTTTVTVTLVDQAMVNDSIVETTKLNNSYTILYDNKNVDYRHSYYANLHVTTMQLWQPYLKNFYLSILAIYAGFLLIFQRESSLITKIKSFVFVAILTNVYVLKFIVSLLIVGYAWLTVNLPKFFFY